MPRLAVWRPVRAVALVVVCLAAMVAFAETESPGSTTVNETADTPSGSVLDAPSEPKETIVIRADRAWEEPDGTKVLHFAGDFELISPEWELRSDEADLHGALDDPERIVARGEPAHLVIFDGESTILGNGLTIEYQRDADVLILIGDAELAGEDLSMKSSEIVYDVGQERLRSSGTDGVEMVLERAK